MATSPELSDVEEDIQRATKISFFGGELKPSMTDAQLANLPSADRIPDVHNNDHKSGEAFYI